MYSSFHTTSSSLCSEIRQDIFSLLGNSGKTIFSPEMSDFTFSFRFFFSKSIQKFQKAIATVAYKKPITYLIIGLSALMLSPSETSFASGEPSEEKTFIVTAYYSPIPGQKSYQMGSYEADIRLNGKGLHGASGVGVFTGMIAAPKTYAFGTHIFFSGLGVGQVEDRGGAIVEAFERGQSYDRLDIWVGYGDDGLYRAKKWGRRIVKGYIVSDQESMKYPQLNIAGIGKTGEDGVNLALFPPPGSTVSSVLNQNMIDLFSDLGYQVKNNDINSMLIQFQLDYKVIKSKDDEGAGIYGPKTRTALSMAYTSFQSKQTKEIIAMEEMRKALVSEHNSWQEKYQNATGTIEKMGNPKKKESGEHIVELQKFLRGEKFYTYEIDGKMEMTTIIALRKYQKSRGIKTSGILDEATKYIILEDIIALDK